MDTSPLTNLMPELDRLVETLPADEVPTLIGDLERLKTRLLMRLMESPAPPSPAPPPQPSDRLLTAHEAATLLGVKPRYLYDHADEIPGRVRLPGRKLRFSEKKLRRWMEARST